MLLLRIKDDPVCIGSGQSCSGFAKSICGPLKGCSWSSLGGCSGNVKCTQLFDENSCTTYSCTWESITGICSETRRPTYDPTIQTTTPEPTTAEPTTSEPTTAEPTEAECTIQTDTFMKRKSGTIAII